MSAAGYYLHGEQPAMDSGIPIADLYEALEGITDMPDTTAPDPATAALPAIERPNGKLYRPKKVSARILVDEDGIESSVLVTGTHDIERARNLARVVARQHVSADCEPADPHQGWWRQAIRNHDPFWEWDEARGAAGVMFEVKETDLYG